MLLSCSSHLFLLILLNLINKFSNWLLMIIYISNMILSKLKKFSFNFCIFYQTLDESWFHDNLHYTISCILLSYAWMQNTLDISFWTAWVVIILFIKDCKNFTYFFKKRKMNSSLLHGFSKRLIELSAVTFYFLVL